MSRTLGFVAGLVVPTTIYHLSSIHLKTTTDHIQHVLHQQSLILSNLTESTPVAHVYVPASRTHTKTIKEQVKDGWNASLERGVRAVQRVAWQEEAKHFGRRAMSFGRVMYSKLMSASTPVVHDAQQKLHEGSEKLSETMHETAERMSVKIHHTADKAGKAMHEVGDALHDQSEKVQEKVQETLHETIEKVQETMEKIHENAVKDVISGAALESQAVGEESLTNAGADIVENDVDPRQRSSVERAIEGAKKAVAQATQSQAIAEDSVTTIGADMVEKPIAQSTIGAASEKVMLDARRKAWEQLLSGNGRRIGFESPDDPTHAARIADHLE